MAPVEIDMSKYIKNELEQVKPDYCQIIRVKFVGDGETRWLNITPEQFEEIKTVLSKSQTRLSQ